MMPCLTPQHKAKLNATPLSAWPS